MSMHNPPHPGQFIREIYLDPYGLSTRKAAESLSIAPSTLARLLNGDSNVTPEMALRLSRVFGRSPESWLAMQDNYSLWRAKKKVDLRDLRRIKLDTTTA